MKTNALPRSIAPAALALIALIVPLGLGAPSRAWADDEESLPLLEEKQRALQQYREKQHAVIRKMQEALASDWPPTRATSGSSPPPAASGRPPTTRPRPTSRS